jgi:hypothetical protein
MPHTPGHNEEMLSGTAQTPSSNNAPYVIFGTEEPYNGMVVGPIGGYFYTTTGGTLEGDSKQLVPVTNNVNMDAIQNQPPAVLTSEAPNPVVRNFRSRVTYYDVSDGTVFRPPIDLHQHADGTIMTGRVPVINGVYGNHGPQSRVVSTTAPRGTNITNSEQRPVISSGRGNMTPPPGNGRGGNTGGNMGGGTGGGY